MGYFSAHSAANAGVIDMCNRIVSKRIRIVFYGQRWTARQANTRMIAGAGVMIDPKAFSDDPLAVVAFLIE